MTTPRMDEALAEYCILHNEKLDVEDLIDVLFEYLKLLFGDARTRHETLTHYREIRAIGTVDPLQLAADEDESEEDYANSGMEDDEAYD
jgi:predicted glycosyltransferase